MDSDEALFDRLVAGDMRAFDLLYARFERPLFRFICARLGDAGEAEDLLHEAFMAVLRERERRSEVRSFRAWLYQVANNLCLNRVRSRKRAGQVAEVVGQALAMEGAPAAAEQAFEEHQRAELVHDAVTRLPEPLAEVFRSARRGCRTTRSPTCSTCPSAL